MIRTAVPIASSRVSSDRFVSAASSRAGLVTYCLVSQNFESEASVGVPIR